MSVLVQQILADLVVLTASAYLFKHYYVKHRIKSGCASCKLMAAATNSRPKPRVTA
jgi:hypothetical protein